MEKQVVYYTVKKEKSEITVTFWVSDRPKEVKKEQFNIIDEERLRFRFKNSLKLRYDFDIMEFNN